VAVLTFVIALRNPFNYDSAGPVLIGMQNPVKYEDWHARSSCAVWYSNAYKYIPSCADRHGYAEPSDSHRSDLPC